MTIPQSPICMKATCITYCGVNSVPVVPFCYWHEPLFVIYYEDVALDAFATGKQTTLPTASAETATWDTVVLFNSHEHLQY